MTLTISPSFVLPVEAVTKTLAIIGKKESGKTYFAGVLEEEMAKNKVPFTVIDPMSAHWGIKERYQVYVFGGPHADVPLDPSLGVEIAETTVETGMSNILDIRDFSEAAQRRFVADFTRTLMEKNQTPRHVFCEEMDKFAPQTIYGEVATVWHEVDNMVRRGRQFGIGVTAISQRPARLNKDTLSQCDAFFFFRMPAPHDRKAVKEWIEGVAEPEEVKKIHGRLPTLPSGTCILYSPEWLKRLQDVTIRERETYHAGRTPKLGEITTFKPVPVDAEALRKQMEELIEAKSQEESELSQSRQRTRHLEEEVEQLKKKLEIRHEVSAILGGLDIGARLSKDPDREAMIDYAAKDMAAKYAEQIAGLTREKNELTEQLALVKKENIGLEPYKNLARALHQIMQATTEVPTMWEKYADPWQGQLSGQDPAWMNLWLGKLHEAPKKVLQFLGTHRGVKFTKTQLAQLTGYSVTGGGYRDALATLRRNNLIKVTGQEVWLP